MQLGLHDAQSVPVQPAKARTSSQSIFWQYFHDAQLERDYGQWYTEQTRGVRLHARLFFSIHLWTSMQYLLT